MWLSETRDRVWAASLALVFGAISLAPCPALAQQPDEPTAPQASPSFDAPEVPDAPPVKPRKKVSRKAEPKKSAKAASTAALGTAQSKPASPVLASPVVAPPSGDAPSGGAPSAASPVVAASPPATPSAAPPAPAPAPTTPFGGLPGGVGAKNAAPAPPGSTRSLADVAGTGAGATDIAAKLKQERAGTCAEAIDLAAAPSMLGVTQSNTLSTWSKTEPRDKHAVSVFIAQHYGNNAAVPYGATGIIASPGPAGGCDATVVQVVSSPLPCSSVKTLLVGKNKAVDLAGETLVQNGEDQNLLVPTGGNACVIVAFRSTSAK